MANPYPPESSDEDDGTMPANVDELREAVVGHRIVSARVPQSPTWRGTLQDDGLILELDNGTKVEVLNSSDCCAYTSLDRFILDPEQVDHVITGVGTTDGFQTWHIYADMGDVLEMTVDWSCGNPFYYIYGFSIMVKPLDLQDDCEDL